MMFVLVVILFGCTHNGVSSVLGQEKVKEYSSTAITLSDFSMKIVAHYESQNVSVPNDFDSKQFFELLGKIYPDQSRVTFVHDHYRVLARPLGGGYSVMLCDPTGDQKIMEDLSCHLNRVEIRSWESNVATPCAFESNWKPYCK
jgi:hypothetical protein